MPASCPKEADEPASRKSNTMSTLCTRRKPARLPAFGRKDLMQCEKPRMHRWQRLALSIVNVCFCFYYYPHDLPRGGRGEKDQLNAFLEWQNKQNAPLGHGLIIHDV